MAGVVQEVMTELSEVPGSITVVKKQERNTNSIDPDAQEMVISSLREQIQDLFSQVSQLNNKLVKSYDRVSDLEDDLHVASSNVRNSSLKISQLELERAQHLSALNTGLLVEKSHVTAELSRLMEKATEEAAQRGQAETARAAIEKDLDDLSATLFGQANTMVAEARYARHLSERKVEEAEMALKGAEEAVSSMQQQMQALHAEKQEADNRVQEIQLIMGKGKWAQRRESGNITRPIRLLSSHLPYQEFLLFVAHLRSLHPTSPMPPSMSTLLPLPFLARLSNEDSEPTVRLDLAPSLNWLSRRSVLSAIYNGQLAIEPISLSSLVQETLSASSTTLAGLSNGSDTVSCALCGSIVFSMTDVQARSQRSAHPLGMAHSYSNSTSWSTSLFKRPSIINTSQPSTRQHSPIHPNFSLQPSTIHVFRLASPSTSGLTSGITLPKNSLSKSSSHSGSSPAPLPYFVGSNGTVTPNSHQSTTIYPLCPSGWCLMRLRTTCTLWAFVRTGIIDRVWEEELVTLPAPPPTIAPPANHGEKPPIPPRKRGIWGIASALGEKAASWTESDKDKSKQPATPIERRLPPPLPPLEITTPEKPPLPPRPNTPPPLPRRSEGRSRIVVASPTFDASQAAEVPTTLPTEDLLPATETKSTTDQTESNETKLSVDTSSPTPAPASSIPPRLHATSPPPRTQTPSLVPLPESRPGTPNRAISPFAAPSTPPPVPRRAAARGARPISALIDGNSRPGTPASPKVPPAIPEAPTTTTKDSVSMPTDITPLAEVKAEEIREETLDDEAPMYATESTGDEVKLPDETITTKVATTNNLSDSLAEDVFVDASESVGAPVDLGTIVRPDSENESETVTAIDKPKINGKDSVVNAIESINEIAEEPRENEDDKAAYIGDATWEERTWKELVRLREDMVWARIGGLR